MSLFFWTCSKPINLIRLLTPGLRPCCGSTRGKSCLPQPTITISEPPARPDWRRHSSGEQPNTARSKRRTSGPHQTGTSASTTLHNWPKASPQGLPPRRSASLRLLVARAPSALSARAKRTRSGAPLPHVQRLLTADTTKARRAEGAKPAGAREPAPADAKPVTGLRPRPGLLPPAGGTGRICCRGVSAIPDRGDVSARAVLLSSLRHQHSRRRRYRYRP